MLVKVDLNIFFLKDMADFCLILFRISGWQQWVWTWSTLYHSVYMYLAVCTQLYKYLVPPWLSYCLNLAVIVTAQLNSETLCCCCALPENIGSRFLVCNLILSQLERRHQKKMEYDLKKMKMEDGKK